ncbi:(2Fe-2S)-binding protein [Tenggerimyces flavus]|uniref:(2Fe-2S)-binding protein n=1 Tax=Tenggerimyces flavus TaxID=1708749 RepID=A0ABV7Y7T8_9ACTN|nr:(2Fe-2S)-binding protein [Tenggerimyces flavus]MBM7785638.1 nicotinate dehydrogenase subunit A [Tenggerimyces flavus]
MSTPLTRNLNLNGENRTVTVPDEGEQLLYVLRNALGQHGPKFGCGVSQCGACTVLLDGQIRRSCVTPLRTVAEGANVETLDGLGTPEHPHPIQQAFIDEQAAQCAYCINGIVMGALGWLRQRRAAGNTTVPTQEEIAAFLSGEAEGSTLNYICRCGAHVRIMRAIRKAAEVAL